MDNFTIRNIFYDDYGIDCLFGLIENNHTQHTVMPGIHLISSFMSFGSQRSRTMVGLTEGLVLTLYNYFFLFLVIVSALNTT